MANYWSRVVRERVSRRRAIAWTGTAVAGLGALSLIGCGDDDESPSSTGGSTSTGGTTSAGTTGSTSASTGGSTGGSTGAASELMPAPVDMTASAVRGGTFSDRIANDNNWYGFDHNLNSNGNDGIAGWVYSHLVKLTLGDRNSPPDGTVEGDFAESFEYSPDGLKVTFRIREGMKWDERAPTNGRLANAEDVVFAYNRWKASNPRGPFLDAELDPNSPIAGVSAPDSKTFVLDLQYPFAPLMGLLAAGPYPLIMPPESEQFDARNTSRGTGPWILEEHVPGNRVTMARNPNYYDSQHPFIDKWTLTVIPDYAAGLAQLQAGSLDTFLVNQEDILSAKEQTKKLVIGQRAGWLNNTNGWIFFGLREGSPYRDDRVRKAFAMEIDRATWLDVYSGRQSFEAAGLPVATRPNTFIGGQHAAWLNPWEGQLGDASQYYDYNIEEAKKLLAAAGHTSPIKSPWLIPDINHNERTEAVRGAIADVGDFDVSEAKPMTYVPDYTIEVRDSHGDFDGVAWTGVGNLVEIDQLLFSVFHPSSDGSYYLGMGEDPEITRLVEAQRSALSKEDRDEVLKELQIYASETMYMVPVVGDFQTFYLYQPWIQNFDFHATWSPGIGNAVDATTLYLNRWIDETKRS